MYIKIVHVTSAHNRNDNRIFNKMCKSIKETGNECILVVEGDNSTIDNIQITGIGKKPKSRIVRLLFYSRKAINLAYKLNADIYHLHDPELLLYSTKLLKKSIVIFDSHENYKLQIQTKKYIPVFLRKAISELYYHFETSKTKKLDAVIIPCTMNGVNFFENRARKIEIINNAPVYVNYPSITTTKKYDVCYVGLLSVNRGIKNLVEISLSGKFNVCLVGKFESKSLEVEILNKIKGSNIEYLGYLSGDQLTEIYNISKIGYSVLLEYGQYNKMDTLATKVYEYMMHGLPVIINKYNYTDNFIRNNKVGLCVAPNDLMEIENAVKFLLDNPIEATRMGIEGHNLVHDKINWEIESKKLIDLYYKLQLKWRGEDN